MRRNMRRRRRRNDTVILFIILGVILALAVLAICFVLKSPVSKKATVEVGTDVTLDLFIEDAKKAENAGFLTDLTLIDTDKLGQYPVQIECGGKIYDSTLVVEDTVAPVATAKDATARLGIMPNAEDCVTDVLDKTEVDITYKTKPDVSKEGETEAVVVLKDEGGNTTEIKVKITVVSDTEPPVIEGAKDIIVEVGDTVSYRKDIVVTDNEDSNPTLTIDSSLVDLDTPGKYVATYTATDKSGNASIVAIQVIVEEKGPKKDRDEVYALAQKVLDDIIDDSMTDMEKAFAIYRWTNRNIMYTGTADKTHWTIGAYEAFTKRAGDCYSYYAAAKAMFDVVGIENVDIVKSDTSHSSHFWSIINLGDGWYHVDCTPRKGSGDLFFMVTDAELEAYSVKHKNSHIFDGSLYPERATESVQDKVDYTNGVIKD